MATTVLHGLETLGERPAGCAVTIGNFDGVHRGHQSILATARQLADREGTRAVVLTFEPPPLRILAPERAPQRLMHLDQRCEALAAAGADDVVVVHTTPGLLHLTPEAFVRDILVDHLGPRHVVEGPNFFFGHRRAGNVRTLAELGGAMGFEVHVVDPVTVELADGTVTRVSSSLVRHLLKEGKVEDAAACLGRPHTLRGLVVRGRGIGRQLHLETANLDCDDQLLPADGVYAAWADLNGRTVPAAVSVGTRPTFGLTERAVEARLLDHEGTLYGRRLALRLIRRLREQRAFDSPDALCRQIAKDIEDVRHELR
ncbi:MAG: bifunctional riboflavin kinase/FAD synthetase [Planctomycetes bacterium]|nr:bifunctional riboflavin kinase/FAD synthetase [Planctomycetota bacterium]